MDIGKARTHLEDLTINGLGKTISEKDIEAISEVLNWLTSYDIAVLESKD